MQFWPPDDEHMRSKHVEAWNKLIVKQKCCASSWLITEINITLSLIWGQLTVRFHSLLRQKLSTQTLNRRANNNKNIITVVSGAVVFVVMNIIINVRRGSGVHSVSRRKLPRGP